MKIERNAKFELLIKWPDRDVYRDVGPFTSLKEVKKYADDYYSAMDVVVIDISEAPIVYQRDAK